jgi:threonine/homoserine/homoserine lactone efflux protein
MAYSMERMIEGPKLALFLSAAFVLAVIPGPGILYVLGRTLNGGRREGISSALGTFLGGLVHAIAAAIGLSALLVESAAAFQIIRYAGAVYLIYLGVTMIRNRHLRIAESDSGPTGRQSLIQGITTEILNPKTALFFLSFIPQFVLPGNGHATLQFLVPGSISVTLNTAVDLVVVFFAAALARRLRSSQSFNTKQRAASGLGMIGLGLYVAVADNR